MAPVKAPFSWPNSSLSSRPVGMAAQLSLTKVRLAAAAQVVNGARDQLLAGAGFAENQNRSVGGRHGGHLFQHSAENGIVADDLAEILLGADLILQIQLLFGELVLELRDLLKRLGVLNRDGCLAGHLAEEIHVGGRESVLLHGADVEGAEHVVAGDQRNTAEGFDSGRRQALRYGRGPLRQFDPVKYCGTASFDGTARRSVFQRHRGSLRDDLRIALEH